MLAEHPSSWGQGISFLPLLSSWKPPAFLGSWAYSPPPGMTASSLPHPCFLPSRLLEAALGGTLWLDRVCLDNLEYFPDPELRSTKYVFSVSSDRLRKLGQVCPRENSILQSKNELLSPPEMPRDYHLTFERPDQRYLLMESLQFPPLKSWDDVSATASPMTGSEFSVLLCSALLCFPALVSSLPLTATSRAEVGKLWLSLWGRIRFSLSFITVANYTYEVAIK